MICIQKKRMLYFLSMRFCNAYSRSVAARR